MKIALLTGLVKFPPERAFFTPFQAFSHQKPSSEAEKGILLSRRLSPLLY
jgi:hypothetical protein